MAATVTVNAKKPVDEITIGRLHIVRGPVTYWDNTDFAKINKGEPLSKAYLDRMSESDLGEFTRFFDENIDKYGDPHGRFLWLGPLDSTTSTYKRLIFNDDMLDPVTSTYPSQPANWFAYVTIDDASTAQTAQPAQTTIGFPMQKTDAARWKRVKEDLNINPIVQALRVKSALIIMDASGSMGLSNPASPSKAANGAQDIAYAYMSRQNRIGAIIFGDAEIRVFGPDDQGHSDREVLERLAENSGGGPMTRLPTAELKEYLERGPTDITFITDGGFDTSSQDFRGFMDLLRIASETNKVQFIYLGQTPDFIADYPGISFFRSASTAAQTIRRNGLPGRAGP